VTAVCGAKARPATTPNPNESTTVPASVDIMIVSPVSQAVLDTNAVMAFRKEHDRHSRFYSADIWNILTYVL
jgi:hypothetical protein